MKTSIFARYPRLRSLRGLVPDEIVESEIGRRADEFEADAARARERIPSVNLSALIGAEGERGAIRLENFLGHWGNVSIEELCKICLIVKHLRPKTVLEIGTYNGMTTLQMALNCPSTSTVYTLDLPEGTEVSQPLSVLDTWVSKGLRQKFSTATGSYFSGRKDVRIVQLLGDSATFDFSAIVGSPDLIFIDAAHDYANKKIDSENAFRLIAPKGIILWHNYDDVSCPDVTKYLADLATSRKIVHLRNTSLAAWRG